MQKNTYNKLIGWILGAASTVLDYVITGVILTSPALALYPGLIKELGWVRYIALVVFSRASLEVGAAIARNSYLGN